MKTFQGFISLSFYLQRWDNLPLHHFSVSLYLFTSFPSYLPRLYCNLSIFHIFFFFISLSFHSASQLIYIPFSSFFAVIYHNMPASSSFIFSLFLSHKTQSCSLWCAPRPTFAIVCMRHALSYCITGWKCW